MRNVELKAVDHEPAASLAVCRRIGARDRGIISQRDTYFAVAQGRLKLREERPGRPHLIRYQRPYESSARVSDYEISAVSDAAAVRRELAREHGVSAVVRKRRHLFLWRQVRIHLDDVEGLGQFIEFEAVAREGSDLGLEARLVEELRAHFAIAEERLWAGGYAEAVSAIA